MDLMPVLGRLLLLVVLPFVLLAGSCRSGSEQSRPASTVDRTATVPTATATPLPNLPDDLSLVALVSKQHALPASYVPPDLMTIPAEYVSSAAAQRLRRPAAEALLRMLADAKKEGLTMKVNSAYRSHQEQTGIFQSEVRLNGCAKALQESAVPGHSEHQLGLAVDLTSAGVKWDLVEAFAEQPEGRWLAANATRYGFVLSYPSGKSAVTGYSFEPWHFRYVGPEIAEAVRIAGQTPIEVLQSLGPASLTISAVVPPERRPGPDNCPR